VILFDINRRIRKTVLNDAGIGRHVNITNIVKILYVSRFRALKYKNKKQIRMYREFDRFFKTMFGLFSITLNLNLPIIHMYPTHRIFFPSVVHSSSDYRIDIQ